MKMYNLEVKDRYLSEKYTNENTIRNTKLIFERISSIEEEYGEDVYNFSLSQLYDLLRYLDRSTLNSLGKDWSIIQKYVKWGIGEGYTTNMAALSIFRKDLKKFINQDVARNQYIPNRQVFYDILEEIYNYQDKVVPVLLYEGVRGRDFEEIKNLKIQDCDFEKREIILRRNDETIRIVSDIEQRSMEILLKAARQEVYYRGNGVTTARVPTLDFNRAAYIVKASIIGKNRHTSEEDNISTPAIDAKIRNVQKITKMYYLNATNIFYSGMFERLRLVEVERELETKDYLSILKQFGMNTTGWQNLKEKYLHYKETQEG